jgi:hypothetical protein
MTFRWNNLRKRLDEPWTGTYGVDSLTAPKDIDRFLKALGDKPEKRERLVAAANRFASDLARPPASRDAEATSRTVSLC